MLAFVVGNTNFNFHRNDNRNTIKSTRKLKSLVIETKKKMDRVVSLSPDACFEDSGIIIDLEDQTLISTFKEHTVLRNSSISLVKSDDDLQKKFFRIGSKINKVEKKIMNYKTIIKWLDLFASIMIIAGCIISQVENEHFYYDNIYDRVEVVKLISDLDLVNSDVSKINFSNYNISYMLEKNENLIKNLNFTNYQELPIPLLISDYGVNMRLIICILTIACIPLIVLGRYLEFIREFQYIEKLDIKFQHSPYCYTLFYEILLITPFQYPGVKSYILIQELGEYICFPYSSILCSLTFIRFYFVLKLFKHLTQWTSSTAENICMKYVCKADTKFAFKAFQKENPFVILGVIFIFTCVCGGLSLRNFELLYWETKKDSSSYMNWEYTINSMWCIFVSICGVGYGDYYAKTQIGRFITIFSCLIGLYFSSMMMIFMTQKSALNENERKAFNILVRLKLRNEIKEKNAHIVYEALVMVRLKLNKLKNDGKLTEKLFQIKFSTGKRKVINCIKSIKEKEKMIMTFCSISFKDKILNISNRIEDNIKEMNQEIDSLKILGEILVLFADCQVEIARYLKKSYYATNHVFSIIEKKRIFKKLNNVNMSLKGSLDLDKLDQEYDDYKDSNKRVNKCKEYKSESPDQNIDPRSSFNFMENLNLNYTDNDLEFEDNIFNYTPYMSQVEEYFKFISSSNQGKKKTILKSMKTLDFMKKKKTLNNRKLIKINNIMEKRKSNNELVKEFKLERKKTLLKLN